MSVDIYSRLACPHILIIAKNVGTCKRRERGRREQEKKEQEKLKIEKEQEEKRIYEDCHCRLCGNSIPCGTIDCRGCCPKSKQQYRNVPAIIPYIQSFFDFEKDDESRRTRDLELITRLRSWFHYKWFGGEYVPTPWEYMTEEERAIREGMFTLGFIIPRQAPT